MDPAPPDHPFTTILALVRALTGLHARWVRTQGPEPDKRIQNVQAYGQVTEWVAKTRQELEENPIYPVHDEIITLFDELADFLDHRDLLDYIRGFIDRLRDLAYFIRA